MQAQARARKREIVRRPQVAPEERVEVEALVRRCMAAAGGGRIGVPLEVDVEVGRSWALADE